MIQPASNDALNKEPPSDEAPSLEAPSDLRTARRLRRRARLPKLSSTLKILVLFVGWFLVLLGLVGLVLPVLQGVLFLTLGAAALSLVSSTIFFALRRLFGRWPRGWKRLLYVRSRIHNWLEKRFGKSGNA